MNRALCVALLFAGTLLAPRPVKAAGVLDLIPEDATAAIGVRNLAEVKTKGDEFFKEIEFDGSIRPSLLFTFLFAYFGLPGNFEQTQPAALILPRRDGVWDNDPVDPLVMAVRYKKLDDIAANFSLKPGELKEEEVKEAKDFHVYARQGSLYVSRNQKALKAVVGTDSLAKALSKADRQRANKADFFAHLGTKAAGEIWGDSLESMTKQLSEAGEKDETVEGVLATASELRFVLFTMHLHEGLHFSLRAVFNDNAKVRKFLNEFRGGDGASGLAGLPDANVLVAGGAKGDGNRNLLMARSLTQLFFRRFDRQERILSKAKRPKFFGALDGVWGSLNGSRMALYVLPEGGPAGMWGVVGILDADDPQLLIKKMAELADVTSEAGADAAEDVGLGKPQFQFKKMAEVRDGRTVHHLTMDFAALTNDDREPLRQLLGKEWHIIRLATEGKQVVVLMGSETKLFDEALANIKNGKPGLGGRKDIASSNARLDKDKKVELHFDIPRMTWMAKTLSGEELPLPKSEHLNSMSMTINPDRIQLDLWLPTEEIREIIQQM